MSTNHSQTGQSPSESSIPNNTQQPNIDQLLSMENMNTITTTTTTTDQSSSIQLNPTDMAVPAQEHNNLTTTQNIPLQQHHEQQQQQQPDRQEQQRQLEQQLQNLRQERLHIQREQSRIDREHNRLQREQQRLQQEARYEMRLRQLQGDQQHFQEWLDSHNRRTAQWQEQENQQRTPRLQVRQSWQEERYRQRRAEWEHQEYLRRRSPGYDEGMDEVLTEREFEEYNLQRLSTQERQAIWEQQHLNQLEENPVPTQHHTSRDDSDRHEITHDDLERHAVYQEEQLTEDELEQIHNIDAMETFDRLEQHNRNEEQLTQREQWEEIEFLYQRLQEPTSNTF